MKTILIKKLSQCLMIALFLACLNQRAYSQTTYRGVDGDVHSLAIDQSGQVYAGGFFNAAGNVWANHIAVWNPNTLTWSALISTGGNGVYGYTVGPGGGDDGNVRAIAIGNDGKVYVGGHFEHAGGVYSPNIAVWDPANATWASLGSGISDNYGGMNSFVNGMAISGNMLYVVGNFSSVIFNGESNIISVTNIAAWNGFSWSNVGDPPPVGTPNTIATPDGVNFYVGGQNGIVHGALNQGIITWNVMDANLSGNVSAIAITPGDRLFIGGHFSSDGGISYCYLDEWNGNAFVPVQDAQYEPLTGIINGDPYGFNGVYALSVFNDNLIIGGDFCLPIVYPNSSTYKAIVRDISRFNLTSSQWFAMGPGTHDSTLGGIGLGAGDGLGVFALAVINGSVTTANVWHSGFEGGTPNSEPGAGSYFGEGWYINSGSVDVYTAPIYGSQAYDGTNYIDLNGNNPGTISTNVATVPGQTYQLSFAYTQNPDGRSHGVPTVAVQLQANGSSLLALTLTDPNNSWANLGWAMTSVLFTATSPSTLFEFASQTSGPYGVFLDAVNLNLAATNEAGIVYAAGGFGTATLGECVDNIAAWDSVANAWSILGNNIPPTVSITSPANGAVFSAPANITIAANAADSDCGVVNVAFYANGTLLGAVTPPLNSIPWNNVQPGTYSLTAQATDTDGAVTTSAAVSVMVDAPPTVSITSPANGTVFPDPANITIAANAADSDGTVSKMDFYQGSTFIGTGMHVPNSPMWIFNWNPVQSGTYSITAKATDNNGVVTTSAAVSVIVDNPPTVSITSPVNGAIFPAPANITITANATDSDGRVVAVVFFQGATCIGAATSAPYSVPWNNVQPGTYTLTAQAYDNYGLKTTSTAVTIFVQAPSCTPAPANLVSWWKAENNANDSMGINNGIAQNITYAAGEVGQTFVFNGTNSYIIVPASSSLNVGLSNGFTFETWVNPTAPKYLNNIFEWNQGSGSGTGPIGVHMQFGTSTSMSLHANIVDTSGGQHSIDSAPNVLTYSNFQHVALTYNNTTGVAVLYCNGVAVATQNLGSFTPQTSFDLYLGLRPAGVCSGNYLLGKLDETSLYNRALSAAEIQAIYNAGSAGKCPPPLPCTPAPANLISWWQAEGNANDSVSGNNGIAQNITYAAGEVGQTFVFNGTDSYITVPASSSLNVGLGNGFTVETWMNPANLNLQTVFEWNTGTNSGNPDAPVGVHMEIGGGGIGTLYANIVDTSITFHSISSSTGVVTTNAFQHVALTYDKTTGLAVLYRNGLAVASQNLGVFTPQTSFNFNLGYRAVGTAAPMYFQGMLDETSLYNRALSAAEIQAIYNAGSAGKCH